MLSVARISETACRPFFQSKYGAAMANRMLSMHKINDSLYLCTEKPRKIEIDKKNFRFNQEKENSKPIVLLISWFYGKPKQINKYSELYTNHGMDVLVCQISLWQFIFSIKDAEQYGQDIADLLHNNEDHYKEIFLHTFSAGGALWGIVQRQIKKNMNKYGNVPKRVIGQVWDSASHNSQAIVAVPFAMFPNNKFLQSLVATTLKIHFTLYSALIPHFNDAVNNVFDNLARAPALLLYSKVDPIGLVDHNVKLEAKWRENGVSVTSKCFENSGHVKHYQIYPEEYLKYLHNHWKLVKLLERK